MKTIIQVILAACFLVGIWVFSGIGAGGLV